LGALFCAGRRVNWAAVFSGSANQFVRLPSYPWQRERCWQECEDVRNSKLGPPGHPLLGRRSRSAVVCWKNFLDLRLLPWLKDHVIHRCVVFPAVGYIEMALSAAREVFGDVPCVIEQAEFQRALPLPAPPCRRRWRTRRSAIASIPRFSMAVCKPSPPPLITPTAMDRAKCGCRCASRDCASMHPLAREPGCTFKSPNPAPAIVMRTCKC